MLDRLNSPNEAIPPRPIFAGHDERQATEAIIAGTQIVGADNEALNFIFRFVAEIAGVLAHAAIPIHPLCGRYQLRTRVSVSRWRPLSGWLSRRPHFRAALGL